MKATHKYIRHLLNERNRYAKYFGLNESRIVYNLLIRLHIRGIKENKSTIHAIYGDDMMAEGLAEYLE